jgi:hypothetical protein
LLFDICYLELKRSLSWFEGIVVRAPSITMQMLALYSTAKKKMALHPLSIVSRLGVQIIVQVRIRWIVYHMG